MDILCTDKTGTLTQDKIVLERHLNIDGEEDDRILRHAFLNSWYQTGLRNLLDRAIIERTQALMQGNPELQDLEKNYTKVDEVPFDFERRRMSVVVEDQKGKRQMITKGAAEEMLQVSAFTEYHGRKFIKALFPKSFADTDLSTIKNFKVEPLKTEIPIDEPENGKLDFH